MVGITNATITKLDAAFVRSDTGERHPPIILYIKPKNASVPICIRMLRAIDHAELPTWIITNDATIGIGIRMVRSIDHSLVTARLDRGL
ncbi:hypothetical protein CVT23_20990 [Minwuia thermotolerans]|uniref:Uncharacterized protein n=1 Tax=Minwuia thermotolerans TaxID=2056226 RepID=A0A2M9FW63_9PROT|nr:hypothetical protein CVT23_20990 [Minwuia thermotolerans]